MKSFFYYGIVITLVTLTSCKKSVSSQPEAAATGHISVFNKNSQLLSDISGTTVTIENTSPAITIPVQSNGTFELPQTNNSGTMVLQFSRPGYGTVKQYYTPSDLENIKKAMADVQEVSLFPKSTVLVNSLSGSLNGDVFTLTCNVSTPESNTTNGVSFFIQKNSAEVSFANCPGNNSVSRFLTIPVNDGNNSSSFCIKCAKDCGFLQAGDTAFIKAYGDIKTPFTSIYTDAFTNKLVFPCINTNSASSTIWFVVP
jgi:hypothetical protein